MKNRPVYLTLLHYPMSNRQGDVVTTSVTNMDLHDIARSCRTYGLAGYYAVTPIEDQHRMVSRILEHWRTDQSREYHPDRFEALSLLRLKRSFDEVFDEITQTHGQPPEVVLTDARDWARKTSYYEYRAELEKPGASRPVILVFGTGWGVSEVFHPRVNVILEPIYGVGGPEGYNHLSVRSAVAIILDRLFGSY